MDVGLQLGDDLLLANHLLHQQGGLVPVGGRFFHKHWVDPGGTDLSEFVANAAELGIDAVATLCRGSQLALGVVPDALSLGLGLSHQPLSARCRLLQLLGNLCRSVVLCPLGVAAGLLPAQPDGSQLLLCGRDLRGELKGRRLSPRGQSRLEVDGRGRGPGPCLFVQGFGLLPLGHGLAVCVLSGSGLAVGFVLEVLHLPPGVVSEVLGLLPGVFQDVVRLLPVPLPGSGLPRLRRRCVSASHMRRPRICVGLLTDRQGVLLGEGTAVRGVRVSPCP